VTKNTKRFRAKKDCFCKGICKRDKAPHKFTEDTKRCRNCDDFVFVDNAEVRNCPCCGYILAHYPQNANLKRKFMTQTKIKYL
jgi:hypothetical protein